MTSPDPLAEERRRAQRDDASRSPHRTRELVELSGPADAALDADSIVVLPTGSIEHHGPHLPLVTDLLMADLISQRLVDAAVADGLDVWRLPPLAYTKSDEHHWAPGTLWISADTLLDTITEIGASLAATKARTLVFFNGHGGNIALLQVALRELRRLYGFHTFLMGIGVGAGDGDPAGAGGPDERGLGIHGGYGETSIVAHLRPDLVDLSQGARWIPDAVADLERLKFNGGPVAFGWTSDDFGPAGVVGDATGANAEHGAALVAQTVADGVASLHEVVAYRAAVRGYRGEADPAGSAGESHGADA